ncbi:unnamed protein product [Anisakis simplex]|uniref:Uncharacterized protein n=1 Tax=Anisakis simplex TaxID=6269 RepID=A0A0M3J519_ANISI|nr:unnamed protein product [Anisakis simplex]
MTATATTTCQEDDKAETSKALKGKEEPSGATEDGGDAVRLRHAKNVNGEQPSASRANASKESSVDRSHQHAHSSSRTGRETKKGSAAHTPSTSTSRHSHHHHQQMSDGTRRSALAACAVADSDEGMTTTHQRRSRRESPRKHLTVNSKVKPVAPSPIRNVANSNWMKVPPDEEPDNLLPTAIRRKESAEKSKVIANGKIVKRNSSKASSKCSNSSKSSPRFDDPANSLLDQYDGHTGRNTTERRRWHTTPIRPNALLRRNQPNTLATGLKATQVHIREHNKLRRSDKMKRGSSSALSCSDQSHVDSDEENSAASVLSPLADTTAILQQVSGHF